VVVRHQGVRYIIPSSRSACIMCASCPNLHRQPHCDMASDHQHTAHHRQGIRHPLILLLPPHTHSPSCCSCN
jgi:hypothetical protein